MWFFIGAKDRHTAALFRRTLKGFVKIKQRIDALLMSALSKSTAHDRSQKEYDYCSVHGHEVGRNIEEHPQSKYTATYSSRMIDQ
jgi:hypothetical protein